MTSKQKGTRPRTPNPVQTNKPDRPQQKGWIAPRTGVRVIAFASIACAVWTGWQVSQFKPPLESVLWGILFGATIWLVAGFAYVINRWIRRS